MQGHMAHHEAVSSDQQHPYKKLGVVECVCNHSQRTPEAGRSWGPTDHPVLPKHQELEIQGDTVSEITGAE